TADLACDWRAGQGVPTGCSAAGGAAADLVPGRRLDAEAGARGGVVEDVGALPLVGEVAQLAQQGRDQPGGGEPGAAQRADPDRRTPDAREDVGQRLALGARRVARGVPRATERAGIRGRRDERARGVADVGERVRLVGPTDHGHPPAAQRGRHDARDVPVPTDPGPDEVGAADLDDARAAGAVRGEGVGPQPGAQDSLVVGRGVRQVLGHGPVDRAVGVEVACDRVDRSRPFRGGEQRRGERRPDVLPLGVVAGVGAVVEHGGAVGDAGQGVGVGGVEGHVRDAVDAGVAPGPGHDGDVRPAGRELGRDVTPDGSGADDDVPVRGGRGAGHEDSFPRAVLSIREQPGTERPAEQERCSRLWSTLSSASLEGMTAPRTARALARETLTREILDAARARLVTDGPAALSLRAVARDVGMVSSAVYRYFPSRDALLTALLVECYDELGAAVETAEAAVSRDDLPGRWLAACRALRAWCVRRPGDFALLYGTPVPGYAAPQDTVEPATRVVQALVRIVADSWESGGSPALAPGP